MGQHSLSDSSKTRQLRTSAAVEAQVDEAAELRSIWGRACTPKVTGARVGRARCAASASSGPWCGRCWRCAHLMHLEVNYSTQSLGVGSRFRWGQDPRGRKAPNRGTHSALRRGALCREVHPPGDPLPGAILLHGRLHRVRGDARLAPARLA